MLVLTQRDSDLVERLTENRVPLVITDNFNGMPEEPERKTATILCEVTPGVVQISRFAEKSVPELTRRIDINIAR